MAEYNVNQTRTTDLTGSVTDYKPNAESLDSPENTETRWNNDNWNEWLGYYKQIPEYKTAIGTFATWVIGKGWTSPDSRTTVTLENIRGWGEDTFTSILWNMLVIKKVNGDAYAELIRNAETGDLENIKPLSPGNVTHVVDTKGILDHYEVRNRVKGRKPLKIQPENMLHLCNGRIGDEIHGTSITEAVTWVIQARNEAMRDWKRLSHRSTVRVMYVEIENSTKLNKIKSEYANAIDKGELMILPAKPGDAEIRDFTLPPVQNFLDWIKYLENFFYQALGVPKVILGGSEEFTEASSKIGYLTFEQVYTKEIEELKADLFNQIGIDIEFVKPASIKNELLQSEDKNTSTEGFQPSETEPSLTRSE